MQSFRKLFTRRTSVIGMIHVDPLPGTPRYEFGSFNRLIEKAKHEAKIYLDNKLVRKHSLRINKMLIKF